MIKLIDSIVGALSLHISNPADIIKYEEAYDELRKSLELKDGITGAPFEYEPCRHNKYLITLPDNFNIRSWQICGVVLPVMSYNFWKIKQWSNLKLRIIEVVDASTKHELVNINRTQNNYSIVFNALDPTGYAVQQVVINVYKITKIDLGFFDYQSSGFSEIKVKNVIVNY